MKLTIETNSQEEILKIAEFLQTMKFTAAPDCQCKGQIHIDEVAPVVVEATPSVEEPVQTPPSDEPAPVVADADNGAVDAVDHPMVRALATELIKKNKSAGVNAIIKGVGASSIGKVPEDQLANVYEQLKGLM